MPIDNASTDGFGNTVHRSTVLPAQSTMVTEMPEGFYQDWHPASRRQLLIVLSGTLEVETSDGKKHRCGSGDVSLADDVGSRGHRTRTIGGPARVFFGIRHPKPTSAANRRLAEMTIAYYDRFARAFWNGTRHHDVSQNYAALLDEIESEPPYSILDLGCGPGRDLIYFRSLEHEAVGLDGSREFVAMARAHSGCEVLHQDFLSMRCPRAALTGFLPTPRCSMCRAGNCRGFCWNCARR